MTGFDFATTERIIFGVGRIAELGKHCARLGSPVLVLTGRERGQHRRIFDALSPLPFVHLEHSGEPCVEDARRLCNEARALRIASVVAVGGGSVLDLGKAIAALLPNPGDVLDYLEVIGAGRPLEAPSLPLIAVPTTAGTGSEVTRNAVLRSRAHGVKASMRSESMLPKLALVDPELCLELPPALTASTGLDAITQLIEAFVTPAANPLTDALVKEALPQALTAVVRAVRQGSDIEARSQMCLASLCGGLALANAKLGAVHGMAAPIGGLVDAPHGAVCAILLPLVCELNLRALRQRSPQHPSLARYEALARVCALESAEQLVQRLQSLVEELGIPPLASYGLSVEDRSVLVQASQAASSMKGNPLPLSDAELMEILERAW